MHPSYTPLDVSCPYITVRGLAVAPILEARDEVLDWRKHGKAGVGSVGYYPITSCESCDLACSIQ